MNFLDLIIIGCLLLGGLIGYHKGLINSIITALASVLALLISFATYKNFIPFLNTQLGLGKLVNGVLQKTLAIPTVTNKTPGNANPLNDITALTNGLPPDLQAIFNKHFVNLLYSTLGNTVKTVGDTITQYITIVIISMLAFAMVFAVSNALLRLLGHAITKSLEYNLGGVLNSLAGFIAGTLAALCIVAVVTSFLTPVIAIYSPILFRLVNGSLLAPYLLKVFVGITNYIGV